MLVTSGEVDFGKNGVAKVTVIDPNVTPESQRRREEAILRICQDILKRM